MTRLYLISYHMRVPDRPVPCDSAANHETRFGCFIIKVVNVVISDQLNDCIVISQFLLAVVILDQLNVTLEIIRDTNSRGP